MSRTAFTMLFLRAALAASVSVQGAVAQGAGDAPPAEELQRASAAFAAAQWSEANSQYAAIVKQYPKFSAARLRLGVTLNELGRPASAIAEIREAERMGAPAPACAYRLAEAFAAQKQPDSAVSELRRAAAGGLFVPPSSLEKNAHFASLRTRADWATVVDAFDAIVEPCLHDPRFREFDFWVGDWDVRPNGAPATGPASRNTVTLEENGCVVMEHWKGLGGSTGMSFNLYDRSIGKWRQTWVDNIGGQHDYAGSLVDGNMVLEGTTPAPNGQLGRIPTRLTLFHVSKDTVRQFSQVSADSGKTWTTNYDLIYVRRAP